MGDENGGIKMKRQLLKFMAACSMVCIAGTAVQAQSYETTSNIPFTFHVGKTMCPAGQYVFAHSSQNTYQTMRNATTGRTIILTVGLPTLSGRLQPHLVFNQYGVQYFLSEVWADAGTGTRLSPSAIEKELRERVQEARINVSLVAQR
jgi:hypothetical protein